MNKQEKELIKDKIDYLKKQQELDKFNLNFALSFYPSITALVCGIIIPILIYFAERISTNSQLITREGIQAMGYLVFLFLSFL